MATYYHATPADNYHEIVREGLRPGIDGLVHLTTDADSAARFILLRRPDCKVGVLQVELDTNEVESFSDGALSGDSHYVYSGHIAPERLSIIPKWWVNRTPKRATRRFAG